MVDSSTPVKKSIATASRRFPTNRVPYAPRFGTAHLADMAVVSPPPIIDKNTVLRVVDVTLGWREIKRFRCGYSGKKAEEEIHTTAAQLASGAAVPVGAGVSGPAYQRVVALEGESGELIAWCAFTRRHLCEVPQAIPPGGYIFAIATAHAYRGYRLDTAGTRPSDAVMTRALEVMREDLGEGEMPYVWARVLPGNRSSNRLFGDHHFGLYTRPAEQMIRARAAFIDPGSYRLDGRTTEHPLAG